MKNGKSVPDRIRKVEAIIISHRELGEADRIVKLFTLENGKLNSLAKGARKIHSRKAPHLEPFTHSILVLARGQSFWIITQADTISNFPSIRADLSKTADASYIMELIDKVSLEGQPEQSLYRLALATLKRIDENEDTFNAIRFFEFRFLEAAGYRPELTNCVSCKKNIEPEDQYFSPVQGGILCPLCGPLEPKASQASKDALRYMRHFQRSRYKEISDVVVPAKIRKEMGRLMSFYISTIMEGRLNTPLFISQIKG